MTAPDRILMIEGYLPNDIRWMESRLGEGVEYIRKEAFPVERLKIESEKPRDAAEAALTAELRWVINEVLSLLEGDADEQL